MTQNEMLKAVVAKSVITDEMVQVAQAMLDKSSKKTSKERAEAEKVNAPLREKMIEYLTSHKFGLASEIAPVVGVSTSKVVALGKELVNLGLVTCEKKKFPKVGERNVYSLVVKE